MTCLHNTKWHSDQAARLLEFPHIQGFNVPKVKKPQPKPKPTTTKKYLPSQAERETNTEPNEHISQTSWDCSAFYASVFMQIWLHSLYLLKIRQIKECLMFTLLFIIHIIVFCVCDPLKLSCFMNIILCVCDPLKLSQLLPQGQQCIAGSHWPRAKAKKPAVKQHS